MRSIRRPRLLTTTAIRLYNVFVIGGCLSRGVVPVPETLTDQDQQRGKSLGISRPQRCAGYELDITSDFFVTSLNDGARQRSRAIPLLSHQRDGGASDL